MKMKKTEVGGSWSLLKEAVANAFRDETFGIAKGAAYSMILSFFPTLLLMAVLLAGNLATAALMREFTYALGRVLPSLARQAALGYFSATPEHSPRLLFSALVISLLAGSGAMTSFMTGFRSAYRLPPRWSYWKEEGIALALVFLTGAPMLAATLLIVFGTEVKNWLIFRLGFPVWLGTVWTAGRWVIAVATGTVILSIIYYVGPHRERHFGWVVPGALLATLAWLLTTAVFGWYVQHVADYADIYGSLGAMVALMIWMYLLAVFVLVGGQFNAVYERRRRGIE